MNLKIKIHFKIIIYKLKQILKNDEKLKGKMKKHKNVLKLYILEKGF